MGLSFVIASALLAASTLAYGQADDKAARRQQLHGAHQKALKACEGKEGVERSECMRRETCAQAADPAQCEARVKEAMAKRDKIREACKDKKGDEYRACIRAERGKT
jgi:hypothetical protein